ncbi:MAG: hypothetical protein R3C28_26640 [Pirellulaceae bacterium]
MNGHLRYPGSWALNSLLFALACAVAGIVLLLVVSASGKSSAQTPNSDLDNVSTMEVRKPIVPQVIHPAGQAERREPVSLTTELNLNEDPRIDLVQDSNGGNLVRPNLRFVTPFRL